MISELFTVTVPVVVGNCSVSPNIRGFTSADHLGVSTCCFTGLVHVIKLSLGTFALVCVMSCNLTCTCTGTRTGLLVERVPVPV